MGVGSPVHVVVTPPIRPPGWAGEPEACRVPLHRLQGRLEGRAEGPVCFATLAGGRLTLFSLRNGGICPFYSAAGDPMAPDGAYEQAKPFGPYNVDVGCPSVAVEPHDPAAAEDWQD